MNSPYQHDNVSAALVGNRRAHQYLRLVDLGYTSEAAGFLDALTDARELVFVAGSLESVARACSAGLPTQQTNAQRQAELKAMFDTHKTSAERLRLWVDSCAGEALRVVTAKWPLRDIRIRFYEFSARLAFDGEEDGSRVRRVYFSEC